MFTASDIADWFDRMDEEHWNRQDEWLLESLRLQDASPVIVFASWFNNRMGTLPNRVASWLTGGVFDLLRLGSDIETDSAWGIAKGAFLNITRLLVVAGPAGRAVGAGSRYAGLVATSTLPTLRGVSAPCRFVSVNNAVSAVRGKATALFASLDDVVKVRGSGSSSGTNMIDQILTHPNVAPVIREAGVKWTNLGNLPSFQDAIRKARGIEGALVVGVKWIDRAGKSHAHRLTLIKDWVGNVKILDYSSGAKFRGFDSLRHIASTRGGTWLGIENATIRPTVLQFESKLVKLLQTTDGMFHLAVPVAMGIRWAKGNSISDAARDIAMSVWNYLTSNSTKDVPMPPAENSAAYPSVGAPPVAGGASAVPRVEYLTGVRYRLKHLGYYQGPIRGAFDATTKRAVIAFQQKERIRIDGIPGPQTQGTLAKVCGF